MQRLTNFRRLGYKLIKNSGLTYGIDDETSLFLALKVSFRVH